MTRLFRKPVSRRGGYLALAAFSVTYLAALALVLSPGLVLTLGGAMP